MLTNDHFDQGVAEALREAQREANKSLRSVKVGDRWVNPSSAALAKRPKPGGHVNGQFKEAFDAK